MARLLLCVLALCAGAYAVPATHEKLDVKVLQERQQEVLHVFSSLHEPTLVSNEVPSDWTLEKNFAIFKNETAVKILVKMMKNGWVLPKDKPFTLNNPTHVYEVSTVFNVLYSAHDFHTMILAVKYLKYHINNELLMYVFQVVLTHWPGMEGVTVPPMYEVFPNYFFPSEVLTTAEQLSVLGEHYIKEFPNTHMWDDNVVITWNHTLWPYNDESHILRYFTHDPSLNLAYYNYHISYPFWLGSDVVPGLNKDRRGELWWTLHQQILARYYMERLSNSLGEIPEITEVVDEKFVSGLTYWNGVHFPTRPAHFSLHQPHLIQEVEEVLEYERRIWEAIDKGYIVNEHGEHVNILTDNGIEILASIIQWNVESLNSGYYKNFLSIWKLILGNTVQNHVQYHNQYVPLVLPSALENYFTAMRDPAFYMMWKRVHQLFQSWQQRMPMRQEKDLALPGVTLKSVLVDKLVTYFSYGYVNVTNALYNEFVEKELKHHPTNVVVATPTLNHKPFNMKLHISSEVAKRVLVKIFLAPKYDSQGYEIPLHKNTENFFLVDMFPTDLIAGDNLLVRMASQNEYLIKEYPTTNEIYEKTKSATWSPEMGQVTIEKFPDHLILPKGKVGGMTFQLVVYLQDSVGPRVPYGTGFNPKTSLGLGSGARYHSDKPFLFPVEKPLYIWQVKDLTNIHFQDVQIHHKPTPEVYVPHVE